MSYRSRRRMPDGGEYDPNFVGPPEPDKLPAPPSKKDVLDQKYLPVLEQLNKSFDSIGAGWTNYQQDTSPTGFKADDRRFEKAKFMRNLAFSENALKNIKKYSDEYGLDPNELAASLAIEVANQGKVRTDQYFNTHTLESKLLEREGIYQSNSLEELYKNAGAYVNDSTVIDSKISRYANRINKRVSELAQQKSSYTTGIEPHARFLKEFGLESVNPAQQNMEGVQNSYVDMINEAANYLKEQNVFGNNQVTQIKATGGSIEIDPSKEGTFKAQASRMGLSVQAAASKILNAPEGRYSPAMRRKANFARNFAKSKGGTLSMDDGGTFFGAPMSPFFSTPNMGPANPPSKLPITNVSTPGAPSNKFNFKDIFNDQTMSGLGQAAALFSGFQNIQDAKGVETDITPTLSSTRERPFQSVRNELMNRSEAQFRSLSQVPGIDMADLNLAYSKMLGSDTDIALKESQMQNQYNLQQQQLGQRQDMFNRATINQISGQNIDRRNVRRGLVQSARTSAVQNVLNQIQTGRQERGVAKMNMMKFLSEADTGVIERAAQSMGLSVEEFLKRISDPDLSLTN